MSREIKFRAWNKELKKLFYVCDSFSLMISDTGNTIAMWCSDGIVDEFKADELMQYTGLKDANGVEIYEGDILNFDWRLQETNELYASDCENIKGRVCFDDGKFVVKFFNNCMSFDLSDINQATFERFWKEVYISAKTEYFKMTGFKVVGNMHKTPELLDYNEED